MNSWALCKQKGFRLLLAGILLCGTGCSTETGERQIDSDSDDFTAKRNAMVATQIEARGIRDPLVLDAMRTVPRHNFVPKRYRSESYRDGPLPIGHSQTISQPYIVALMTQLMQLKGGERVLEIGTGSGYQTAVLARVVGLQEGVAEQSRGGLVFSIEIVKPLCRRTEKLLSGTANLRLRCGDGYNGWPEQAPFDAIMVTAAPPRVPRPLLEQLNIGGRLIIPVGDFNQELLVFTRTVNGFEKKRVIGVRFVPMTGEAQKNIDGP